MCWSSISLTLITSSLVILFPNLEFFTQDLLKLRTYTLASVALWVIMVLVVGFVSPLSRPVQLMGVIVLWIVFKRHLMFPLHALYIWTRHAQKNTLLTVPMRYCFQRYFRLYHNLDVLLSRPPHILLANYPNDRFESFAVFMLPVPYAFVMKESSYYSTRLKLHSKMHTIFVKDRGSYSGIKRSIPKHLGNNRFIFGYVNNPSSVHPRHFERYRTGLVRIAIELGVPISLIAFDQFQFDQWTGALSDQSFRVHVSEMFQPRELDASMVHIRTFFQTRMEKFEALKLNLSS